MPLRLKSTAFANGGTIPREFTADAENVSPPLVWQGEPEGTKSYALIVDDPDAPHGTWNHWLVWNLPADQHELRADFRVSAPVRCGTNDFGETKYGGPSPPPGSPHRYYFRLFALDTPSLDLGPKVKRDDLEDALSGHVLAKAVYMGRYHRTSPE